MRVAAALSSLIVLVVAAGASAQAPSAAVRAALADPGRPATDTAKDADRHPGELLAFAGVKPGQKVGDFIMGGGYFTRILAQTVGPKGHVWAYQPAEFIQFRPAYGEEQKKAAGPYANVTPLTGPLMSFAFPEPLDVIVTTENYHDMHLKYASPELASQVDVALFKALKPGGVLLVTDHVAEPGRADAPDNLHRIDPAIIRREVEAAGFRLDGESAILRNPADMHTLLVFNPTIRGHTDQVVYRFRKPR